MKYSAAAIVSALLVLGLPFPGDAEPPAAPPPAPPAADKKFEDFDKVVKDAKEIDGLFKLYQKEEHLYAEIRFDQFDKPLLCPIAIARGMGMGGYTLNFDEQWVLIFRRIGDKLQLVRRNVHFQAKKDSPVARAVETTYADSILLAIKILSINQQRQSALIDFNDIFMSDFAQLHLGAFDANRSSWHKVKAFPRNVELEVAATYAAGDGRFSSTDSVIDARGNTIIIHYGLCQMPEDGYQPRLADDRVGHFLSVVKDFSSDNRDTAFQRYVTRWRLERADADPKHKDRLSPPKKKIVFWIENSVPDEYRAYVREGILEWNKAFEKVGFLDAIEVRQQESEDFDPEDINYNTFRWITTGGAFAMGPSRTNPLTGEILDADIIFDADMVRFWRQEYPILSSAPGVAGEEPASLIQATRLGWGLADPRLPHPGQAAAWSEMPRADQEAALRLRLQAVRQGVCQCGAHMKYELGLGAMAMAARGDLKPGDKVPEELIGQAVKEVVMHEVGHTLGLRHNFKASTMLKNEQLQDTTVTRKLGLVGSVMDYSPINLAPKGVKQGDYFTTTIGPYDYWAIEYAYKPLSGGADGELDGLQKIAAQGNAPGHDYATDEDLYGTADPLVNVFDLGADPMKFAQDRMVLAEDLLKDLPERVVDKGEGYQRVRVAFNILMGQFGNGAYLVANFVGGESMNRDHRDDPNGRDPFVPVKAAKQREALKFLQDHVLSDRTFQFSPQLLRHLGADRWTHWGNERSFFSPVEYPLHEHVLRIQRIVLDHLLDPEVLTRIQDTSLKADKDEQPLTVAEVFRSLTDGIWGELPPLPSKGGPDVHHNLQTSVLRRNLQREHLRGLGQIVLGKSSVRSDLMFFFSGATSIPPDARSLARMHLREIGKRIETTLDDKQMGLDDTTRAHLEECQERIAKVLGASIQVQEP